MMKIKSPEGVICISSFKEFSSLLVLSVSSSLIKLLSTSRLSSFYQVVLFMCTSYEFFFKMSPNFFVHFSFVWCITIYVFDLCLSLASLYLPGEPASTMKALKFMSIIKSFHKMKLWHKYLFDIIWHIISHLLSGDAQEHPLFY